MNQGKEYIFIGSGPVCQIKAILLLKEESTSKITFIDSASQAGGAWYSDISPKGSEIETGCHIWSYCPKVFKFIEEEIKVPLFNVTPSPVFNTGRVNISYGLKGTLESYKLILTNLLKLKFGVFKKIKNIPYVHYKIFGKHVKYPKKGSPEFINKLQQILSQDSRVTFLFDSNVRAINIDSRVSAKSDDQLVKADKLFLTSTSALQKLDFQGEKIEIAEATRTVNYIHYLVQLDKIPKKQTRYIRLTNDKIIHRVTDISYQSNFNENLILVGVKEEATFKHARDEIMNHILKYLRSQKIISNNCTVAYVKEYCFPTCYSNEQVRTQINKLDNSKIQVLHSTDLMYGIHNLLLET